WVSEGRRAVSRRLAAMSEGYLFMGLDFCFLDLLQPRLARRRPSGTIPQLRYVQPVSKCEASVRPGCRVARRPTFPGHELQHGLGAGTHMQLLVDVFGMDPDGVVTDRKQVGDLLAHLTLREQ